MKYFNMAVKISEDIKELLQRVQDNAPDFEVYLGGGYLRDAYTRNTAKDVDIFLIPKKDEVTQVPLATASGLYVSFHKVADNEEDMRERGIAELYGIYSPGLTTPSIQFIVYDRYLHHTQLVSDLDMNINQIAYSVKYGTTLASEAFLLGHKDKVIECLHDYDPIRMYSRFSRMESKFSDYRVIGKPVLSAPMVILSASPRYQESA